MYNIQKCLDNEILEVLRWKKGEMRFQALEKYYHLIRDSFERDEISRREITEGQTRFVGIREEIQISERVRYNMV